MKRSKFDFLKTKTNNATLIWKDVHGIAPDAAAIKLDAAMLNWQSELTQPLEIWISKGLSMTEGELILARANLGAVVESWLKFFYCVYYDDYCKDPITNSKRKMVEPEKASFDNLKDFSTGKLWDDVTSDDYVWVDSVQHKRNAIHSFRYINIGTPQVFSEDWRIIIRKIGVNLFGNLANTLYLFRTLYSTKTERDFIPVRLLFVTGDSVN